MGAMEVAGWIALGSALVAWVAGWAILLGSAAVILAAMFNAGQAPMMFEVM